MPGTEGRPNWLSDEEQQAWRATVHLSQLLMRQLDRDLNAHGLSGHDDEILVELSEAPGNRMRRTDLADATSRLPDLGAIRLKEMDEAGIDFQVISHVQPAAQIYDADTSIKLSREANDVLHEACRAHPDRSRLQNSRLRELSTLVEPGACWRGGRLWRCRGIDCRA